ncbi:MAG TPA: STAS domain-containing protein [Bacteroidia bacterium]|jgi:ABC-type transporter Mla MlaB component|nr:STAS domain-containing protein [Bacteroidia bacterium]
MEKRTEVKSRFDEAGNFLNKPSESISTQEEKKSRSKIDFALSPKPGIKSINLSGDKLIITAELSGVFCQGIQYYDLKNILFINNTGMANLIDLLKSLLKQGVEVRFVNVSEKIKEKIKSMGLENVLHCS